MDSANSHVLVAIIIWCSAVLGYLSSLSCSGSPRVLALGNTFGGGVLLAAGLVHLANDSLGAFEEAKASSWAKRYDFPWAAFFVSLGFLLTLFIEETVLHIIEKTESNHEQYDMLEEPLKPLDENSAITERGSVPRANLTDCFSAEHRRSSYSKAPTLSARMMEAAILDHDDHDYGAGDVIERGMAVAVVFLLAISCHSFIAGLGVGAMSGRALWSGMIALVAHKGLATFTLATCFIKAGCPRTTLTCYIALFSIVTPFGILCGSLMASAGGATDGVLIGFAGGSFLYIGVLEVISKEMQNSTDKILKLLVLILGWGLISSLAIWV